MAQIAAGDVTYTLVSDDASPSMPMCERVFTISFGDGSKEYTNGGIPLTKAKLGCPSSIQSLIFIGEGGTPGNVPVFNFSAETIRLFRDGNVTVATASALTEMLTSAAVPVTTLRALVKRFKPKELPVKPAKQIGYLSDPSKFDLTVQRWDGQGMKIADNPYRMYVIEGSKYFERPLNSGNLWFENNQPAGRVKCTFNDAGHISKKEFDFDAEHVAYTPALKGAEKVHFELEQERARTAELEAELASIRGERKQASAPVAEKAAGAPTAPTLTKRS